ncbi:circularly permuted type 2 ATP-grasp protein [Chryseolinea lacunae]|uniref:Circularly permuted type 2 ATP-grasp protein n=1 Tax=Chryseolinea lacunae TaxID=2801331 RepID=A0ABS1KS98_9BACT|nr:circularly permuted type 2 ATP-grasp protein [Chryseolinea lacunae]MBL0742353.1 circularly permuted type 2 ATP-grasp protein [Chryseolinea lacunae]
MNPNTPLETWTRGYFANRTLLDECFGFEGEVKDHWKRLLHNIEQLDQDELKGRQQELLKLLKENGVTYNVYGDTDGLNRPWLLDTMPLLISGAEWRITERGMKQRAYVLNKVLEDLYGERKLLKERIIPPELIYAHSGFLRPCDKIKLPGANQLILYAADLSRGPDGKVWVLKDRTQAPSGMGYALENRSALSRVVPELFRDHSVNKLGGFFNNMMQAFLDIAPQGKEQPRVVLLTPGPRNETYFEHAFLASYMGFTLAQGEDLVVRNGYVWIKTVEGLEKVDVILRRIDDTFCDPLELREDSHLGVPGLLEAIRKGNVSVANPLGSSILENTGLMAFMHNVFKYFLNEDPVFKMVATWWCGQPKEMNHVIQNIDTLVIKKIDRGIGSATVIGSALSKAQKEDLVRRIKAQPYLYVGQEEVGFSTSPVFMKGKLEPRYTVLRTFLVAAKGGYDIMPGGLTRCSPEKGSFLVSNQDGGIAKDTWVENTPKTNTPSLLHHSDLKRKAVLPSRAAENLFWVGRYAQRVVRTSRFIRIVIRNLGQSGYLNNGQESEAQKALLRTVTHITGSYPGFLEEDETVTVDNRLTEIHKLICHENEEGSILYTVNSLLKAMYAVRDRWSIDNWRIIDDMEDTKRKLAVLEPQGIRHVFTLLDQMNGSILSFLEMNRQSMYRGEGWLMYRIGQLIEEISLELTQYRALLTFQYEEHVEFQILEALLVSNQNLSNYRSVYRTYFDIAPALDLLFLNKQNPISILSQLEQLLKFVEQLPQKEKGAHDSEISNIVFECYSLVRLINVDKLMEVDKELEFRLELDRVCELLSAKISVLSVKLTALYFSHSIYQSQGSKDNYKLEV